MSATSNVMRILILSFDSFASLPDFVEKTPVANRALVKKVHLDILIAKDSKLKFHSPTLLELIRWLLIQKAMARLPKPYGLRETVHDSDKYLSIL